MKSFKFIGKVSESSFNTTEQSQSLSLDIFKIRQIRVRDNGYLLFRTQCYVIQNFGPGFKILALTATRNHFSYQLLK